MRVHGSSTRVRHVIVTLITVRIGGVTLNMDTPFFSNDFVGLGQSIDFNSATGQLVLTGLVNKTTHSVVLLDPSTKQLRSLGMFPHPQLVQSPSTSGLDTHRNVLDLHLYARNASGDGKITVWELDVSGNTPLSPHHVDRLLFNLLYDTPKQRFASFAPGAYPQIHCVAFTFLSSSSSFLSLFLTYMLPTANIISRYTL